MIPTDWQNLHWGDLATLEYGKGLTGYKSAIGSCPVFGANGQIGFHTEPLYNGPGVVIGRKGIYRGVQYSKIPFFVIDTAFYLKPKIEFDMRWAYYQLLTQDINSMDSGSAIPSTSRPDFYALPVQVPTLHEQQAIAEVLGSLDDKIELNRCMNATLQEIASTLFRHLFMDNPEAKDWGFGSILEFAELLSGGTPSTVEPSYWNGNIDWVSAKDVGNADGYFLLKTEKKVTEAGLENSSTKLLPLRTTIVTARGTVGAYCLLGRPMTINQTNYGLKAKKGIGDYFVHFSLKNIVEQLHQQSYGTIFDTITTRTFRDIPCIQPPEELISRFENLVSPFMDSILNNQEQSLTLSNLRNTLLPRLMCGDITLQTQE